MTIERSVRLAWISLVDCLIDRQIAAIGEFSTRTAANNRGFTLALTTVRTKAHFLLQLGYFRARQRFFRVDVQSVRDDIEYLSRRYLDNAIVADISVSDHTRKHHVALILGLFRYRLCERDLRLQLEERALSAARISSRPVYVLRDLVDHMRQTRIVLPGYTYLQDMVRRFGPRAPFCLRCVQ